MKQRSAVEQPVVQLPAVQTLPIDPRYMLPRGRRDTGIRRSSSHKYCMGRVHGRHQHENLKTDQSSIVPFVCVNSSVARTYSESCAYGPLPARVSGLSRGCSYSVTRRHFPCAESTTGQSLVCVRSRHTPAYVCIADQSGLHRWRASYLRIRIALGPSPRALWILSPSLGHSGA